MQIMRTHRGLIMRRLLVAFIAAASAVAFTQVASAADLPRKAPAYAPPPPPVYSWTGFYIGANIGGGWGERDVHYSPNDPASNVIFGDPIESPPAGESFKTSGVLGGLQLGYNWQFNRNWLVGLETDFDWSGMKGSASTTFGTFPITTTVDEHIKWFGTVRARLGYLPMDNLLAYVTGGFAYGKVDHTGAYANDSVGGAYGIGNNGGFSVVCGPGTCFAGSSSDVATGWTVGGGLEYAFWNNLTLKAEYLYVSLANKSVTETALGVFTLGTLPASFDANFSRTNFNVARVGVNYRF